MIEENLRKLSDRWLETFALTAATFYLYINLFTFSHVPFLLDGDQQFFWVYAQRMLYGQHAYKDFFQFTPLGTNLVYLAFFHLFGPRIWVTNLAVLFLGLALFWICFELAKQLMERNLALLAAFLFLVLAYGGRLDATHHWYSALVALCAIRVLMPRRTLPRIALAGTLFGVASFFTQTVGVAGTIALLLALAWENTSSRRPLRTLLEQQLLALASFVLVLSALSAYLIVHVGWKQLWYFEVTYPRLYVRFGRQFLIPEVHTGLTELAQHLFLYTLMISIYPAVLRYCWRRRREPVSPQRMQLVLLSLFGLTLLLAIITRVNWNRIYAISMPAIILLLWGIDRLGKFRSSALTALWIIVAGIALNQVRSKHVPPHQIADLPGGKVALSPQMYEKFSWLTQHTKPGELFLQAQLLNTYLPLDLHNPLFIDGLWRSEITRPEYVQRAIQEVEQDRVTYILWSPRLGSPDKRSTLDRLAPFRTYLADHYTRVQQFSDADEIWKRR
jgi:hypothetical protein